MVSYFPLFVFQAFLAWQIEPIGFAAKEKLKNAERLEEEAAKNSVRVLMELASAKLERQKAAKANTEQQKTLIDARKILDEAQTIQARLDQHEADLNQKIQGHLRRMSVVGTLLLLLFFTGFPSLKENIGRLRQITPLAAILIIITLLIVSIFVFVYA